MLVAEARPTGRRRDTLAKSCALAEDENSWPQKRGALAAEETLWPKRGAAMMAE